MRIAMHGQKVEPEARETADGCLNRGGDVEELEVKKNSFVMFGLEFAGQRKAPPRQHAQANFVKADAVAQALCQIEPRQNIGNIEGNDQAVIFIWGGLHGGILVSGRRVHAA